MRGLPDNRLWYICSIILNALGNSFMIIANFGSSPWAAAGENLSTVLPFSIGVCIILLNFFSLLLSYLMKIKFTLGIILKSIALTLVFGLMIDLFLYFHHILFVPESIWVRCIYIFIGLNLMAVAISIYFRTSSVYIPSDYLIKAFGKLMKNYTVGTILCTLIPISISLTIILFQQQVTGLGIGTLTYLFVIGFLIDQYNRWIVIHEVPEEQSVSI